MNLSSAVPTEHLQLTPRTPKTPRTLRSASGSQTSRFEEEFPLTEADADDLDANHTLQSAPLLTLSSTARLFENGSRKRKPSAGERDGGKNQISRSLWAAASVAPLAVGILTSGILLLMLVLSLTRPESLHRYLGMKSTPGPSNVPSPKHAGHNVHGQLSIPPLHPIEYLKVCTQLKESYVRHGDYWDYDLAPDAHQKPNNKPSTVCTRTITYMLDGTVGLTADLALMAQAAALARERNRTFLVDDTYWNRGKWTDHFEDPRKLQPGPQPGCKPPPGNELVACPRTARHWVITPRTAKFHFGDEFSNHYEDSYGRGLNRLRPIFMNSWESFTFTIRPTSAIRDLIKLARESFSSFLRNEERGTASGLPFVSTHIRRGDRKTLSFSFPDRKVPTQNYIDAIESTWSRLHHSTKLPVVYLATDAPEALEEFVQSYDGVVYSLFTAPDPRLRALASPGEYYQNKFENLNLPSRITATSGMIVDLAVLSGLWPDNEGLAPDAVICALSSNICRLAPIGMGWEMAFGHVDITGKIDEEAHRWIDVDEQGLIIPVWEAFELF